ncbi:MAG TPA: NAD(P)H-hydrate epimerase [Candidatus Caenarcaniphilales bacterium]|nr:NAD(P)H-hydrate epimerase [Candidatus Caenarcaniphilales bacterium]
MTAATPVLPTVPATSVPTLSAAAFDQIDRVATEELGIESLQMFELAGAALAEVARREIGSLAAMRAVVLVGDGSNAGAALVAGRHLANLCASVHVILSVPARRLPLVARNRLATLIAMGVRCCVVPWDLRDDELSRVLDGSDVVIDAILGDGMTDTSTAVRDLIARVAAGPTPVLSVEVPTGVDADTGMAGEIAVKAAATLAIGLPKPALMSPLGRAYAGRRYLADIGLPRSFYGTAGPGTRSPFQDGPLVVLD